MRTPSCRLPVDESEMAQFAQQLGAAHRAVADRVEETVAHLLVEVLVVDDAEPVAQERLLRELRAAGVLRGVAHEVEPPVGRGVEHRGQRMLRRVARAGRSGVEDAEHIGVAQTRHAVAFEQGGVVAPVEFVGDCGYGDALTGVAEDLRTREHQDVVVRVAGDGGLERRLAGAAQLFAEVHAEVGEVLHDDRVVLRRQPADDLQFLFREADPRRVVRVGVDDRRDVALAQIAFELLAQLLGAVVVDVERDARDVHQMRLAPLHGETRVDEEDLPALRVEL